MYAQEAAQLMLMMRGSVARLPINVQEATQLMLMMLGSGGPAADHVQEAAQLMLMMLGSGAHQCARNYAADADDARVGWPRCRCPSMCKKLRS